MASTPERPAFLLLWIVAVTLTVSGALSSLVPDATETILPAASTVSEEPSNSDEVSPASASSAGQSLPADWHGASWRSSTPVSAVSSGGPMDQAMGSTEVGAILECRVSDPQGLPCPGVAIKVRPPYELEGSERESKWSIAGRTDQQGLFSMPIPKRTQKLMVQGWDRGRLTKAHTVDFGQKHEILLDLTLRGAASVPRPQVHEEAALVGEGHQPHHWIPTEPAWQQEFWQNPFLVMAEENFEEEDDLPGSPERFRIQVQRHPRAGFLLHVLFFLKEFDGSQEQLQEAMDWLPEDVAEKLRRRAQRERDKDDQEEFRNGFGGLLAEQLSRGKFKRLKNNKKALQMILELNASEAKTMIVSIAQGQSAREVLAAHLQPVEP